jgi:hypothetical protein
MVFVPLEADRLFDAVSLLDWLLSDHDQWPDTAVGVLPRRRRTVLPYGTRAEAGKPDSCYGAIQAATTGLAGRRCEHQSRLLTRLSDRVRGRDCRFTLRRNVAAEARLSV